MNSFEKLLSEFLDGSLDSDGQRELVLQARVDPEKHAQLIELYEQSRLMDFKINSCSEAKFVAEVMKEVLQDQGNFVSSVQQNIISKEAQRRRKRVLAPLLAMAASIAVVAGIFAWNNWHRSQAPGDTGLRISALRGEAYTDKDRPLAVGDFVGPGGSVVTRSGTLLSAVFTDRSTLEMNQNAHVRVPERTDLPKLFLEKGAIYCSIVSRKSSGSPFSIRTAGGHRIDVMGTRFELLSMGQRTELLVETGEVALHAGNNTGRAQALQKLVAKGNELLPAESISLYDIAAWKYANAPKDTILFADDFEAGLGNWRTGVCKGTTNADFVPDPSLTSAQKLVRVEEVVRDGKKTRVMVLEAPRTDKHTAFALSTSEITPNLAISVEFDARSETPDFSCYFIFSPITSTEPGARILYAMSNSGNYHALISAGGKWYRNRIDFLPIRDKDGKLCIEANYYANEKLVLRVYCSVDSALGCIVCRGRMMFDNYVIRDMRAARRAEPRP